jgi:thymidylate synthase
MEIIEKNALDAWKASLRYIMNNGQDFKDRDDRMCRECLNFIITIEHPEADFEAPIDVMNTFDFIYPTKEELSSIILNKEELATYEYSYGPRIFNFQNAIDQIHNFIIPLLKKEPMSRRGIVSLFNPATDSHFLSKNIPSLLFIYFKIRDGKLHVSCFIRSNDFFIGWPGNIYQIFVLQKYVSEKLGIPTGTLNTISCSGHVFHEHFEMIEKIIKEK